MEKITDWDPRVLDAIEDALDQTEGRRVATFDFDNTCIKGDIGELFSHYLSYSFLYRTDLDAFWDLIHPDDGRDAMRQAADKIAASEDPNRHPQYDLLVGELNALYLRKLKRDGKREAYAWAVRLHVGLTISEMQKHSRICLQEELNGEFRNQTWPLFDGSSVSVERGLRPLNEIKSMMAWLNEKECEVWVVSATNEWTVEVAAKTLFGVSADRVMGNRSVVNGEHLGSDIVPPSFFREGKRIAIEERIGVQPVVAFGDSDTDIDMLRHAKIAMVIDHGNAELRELAKTDGWFLRPQSEMTF